MRGSWELSFAATVGTQQRWGELASPNPCLSVLQPIYGDPKLECAHSLVRRMKRTVIACKQQVSTSRHRRCLSRGHRLICVSLGTSLASLPFDARIKNHRTVGAVDVGVGCDEAHSSVKRCGGGGQCCFWHVGVVIHCAADSFARLLESQAPTDSRLVPGPGRLRLAEYVHTYMRGAGPLPCRDLPCSRHPGCRPARTFASAWCFAPPKGKDHDGRRH